ncbi:BamA/TamA family outer membrane protein [Carboxylicivirga sp. M1479]|uniref:BamA/TamA family outer membrane protein n=1 Tax=Carboxylicivirga sp. M1479 TaxID=2594476 RepID=UPI001178297A|nr:BamA/TamA family outer membrane protein [Carboxylicivirga sp. M1479]TRX63292.1 BamA/TamA family outer membrane protein [Carboxylicivirga sp. M1479]
MRISIFVFLCAIILSNSAHLSAQRFLSKEWADSIKVKKERKEANGSLMVMPLAGPAYTPELKLSFAGGVMTSFMTNKKDSLIQRSSAPIMLGLSTSGAYFIGTKLTSFWLQDKIRIYGDFNFKHMPDNYWGVGYDEGRYTEKSDSTTAYTRTWWQINPRILWQFKPNYFAGLVIDYNYTQGSEASKGVAEDPYYQQDKDRPLNGGFGLIFQFDSRDVPVNAWSGMFAEFSATSYNTAFGGDNNYEIIIADFRKYWTIKKQGRTIATQLKGQGNCF